MDDEWSVCVCVGDRSAQRRYHRRLRRPRLRAGRVQSPRLSLRPEAEDEISDEIQISSGLPQTAQSDPSLS